MKKKSTSFCSGDDSMISMADETGLTSSFYQTAVNEMETFCVQNAQNAKEKVPTIVIDGLLSMNTKGELSTVNDYKQDLQSVRYRKRLSLFDSLKPSCSVIQPFKYSHSILYADGISYACTTFICRSLMYLKIQNIVSTIHFDSLQIFKFILIFSVCLNK